MVAQKMLQKSTRFLESLAQSKMTSERKIILQAGTNAQLVFLFRAIKQIIGGKCSPEERKRARKRLAGHEAALRKFMEHSDVITKLKK